MGKYLHLFDTVSAYTEARENDYLEPWVSYTIENEGVNYNKTEREKLKKVPLTFEILSNGAINWMLEGEDQSHAKTIEYKKNDGEWTSITSTQGGVQISVVSGDTVQFRGDNLAYAEMPDGGINTFYGTDCQFNVKGNIMSLIDSDDFASLATLACGGTFAGLFMMCWGLISAENLILPATTLTEKCYYYMFIGCERLTTAPELPATTLADSCYYYMFYGCTNLNYIKCLATDISATGCVTNWVSEVSSTGTFVKSSSMTGWETGVSGIPTGWTVETA